MLDEYGSARMKPSMRVQSGIDREVLGLARFRGRQIDVPADVLGLESAGFTLPRPTA